MKGEIDFHKQLSFVWHEIHSGKQTRAICVNGYFTFFTMAVRLINDVIRLAISLVRTRR